MFKLTIHVMKTSWVKSHILPIDERATREFVVEKTPPGPQVLSRRDFGRKPRDPEQKRSDQARNRVRLYSCSLAVNFEAPSLVWKFFPLLVAVGVGLLCCST